MQLATNALSDTPVALHRLIPFPVHGLIEKYTGPAFAAAALMTDGTESKQNLSFVIGQTLLATTIYNLTDYQADPDE
jgi:hypothetical protein